MPNCPRLDVQKLETAAEFYFDKGLADSTKKSYMSARNRYVKFSAGISLSNLPLSEHKLCLFVSHLAKSGSKYQTVKCYLSAFRYFQISVGMGDPFTGGSMPRLEYITKAIHWRVYASLRIHHKAIKKAESENPCTRTLVRVPITPKILLDLNKEWDKGPITEETLMI